MHKEIDSFKEKGIQVVGLSYDKVDTLKKFHDKNELSFPLLSDEGSKVIQQLKLEDKRRLPHSGTIIIDKEKKVRAKIFLKGYRTRHGNEDLLKAAKAVGL